MTDWGRRASAGKGRFANTAVRFDWAAAAGVAVAAYLDYRRRDRNYCSADP